MAFTFGAQPQQPAASSQPASLFGSSNSTPSAQNKPLFSFGASSAPAASTSAPLSFSFGAPAPTAAPSQTQPNFGLFSSQQTQPNALQQSQAQPTPSLAQSILAGPPSQEPSIQDRLSKVHAAWDPSNPACAFQTYVYNVMDPARLAYVKQNGHQRTAADTNDALWHKSQRENPDPAKYYATLITGHDNLKKRVLQQEDYAARQQSKLDEFQASLNSVSSKHSLETSLRIAKATQAQSLLSARVLRLVSRLHPLTPNRSSPITKDEDELKAKIDKLVADYTGKRANTIHTSELVGLGSAGSHADAATALNGRLSARLNELWVAVAQRKAKRAFAGSKEEWAVVDETEVGKVLEVLAQQQRTLDYLADTLQRDTATLDVIKAGFDEPSVAQTNQAMRSRT